MRRDVERISSDRLILRETKNVSKKAQLSFPYLVDERLCVGHAVNISVGYMVLPFDTEHNPVAGSRKCIGFGYHVLR